MRYARKEWKFKGMKGETKIEMIEKQSNIKQTQKLKEENDLVKYALGHLFQGKCYNKRHQKYESNIQPFLTNVKGILFKPFSYTLKINIVLQVEKMNQKTKEHKKIPFRQQDEGVNSLNIQTNSNQDNCQNNNVK